MRLRLAWRRGLCEVRTEIRATISELTTRAVAFRQYLRSAPGLFKSWVVSCVAEFLFRHPRLVLFFLVLLLWGSESGEEG